jgi:KUP system potassium uptake protein
MSGPTDHSKAKLLPLALGALGVVYGDIGTSPLYAMRECFHGHMDPTPENVLGVLSLIVWSLIVVIAIKYLLIVLRADNAGEGGILALMALVIEDLTGTKRQTLATTAIVTLGLFGAALLYGDGIITPAISVLSAVEGLEIATPVFSPYVVPITIVILVALFLVQKRGTERIGTIFGPVMLLWFLTLAVLGVRMILVHPTVLAAFSPHYAFHFLAGNGSLGFVVLGAVFLVVTGGEALYADMGHFGKRPIQYGWFTLVFPALLLNYLGQGALLLEDPKTIENPFYLLAPEWALYPLVAISTLATVIASQAVITGAFSLTLQAVQFGYLPRMLIRHTSHHQYGQIYVPLINYMLLFATIGLVLGFHRATALAAAYGIAVTMTMVITDVLVAVAMRRHFKWAIPVVVFATVIFMAADLSYFAGNIVKVAEGGWFPLGVGITVFVVMATWRRGNSLLRKRIQEALIPLDEFTEKVSREKPQRVEGVFVFMTSNLKFAPLALIKNYRHNQVVPERTVFLTVQTSTQSRVPDDKRISYEELGDGFCSIVASYGFMERPNIPECIDQCARDYNLDFTNLTYVLGRETVLATDRPGMALWREELFAFLARNALRATTYFRLPPERVLEIGAQIDI